ncbi:MAG: DNA polymerase III subunit gamma/tau [Ignavibacteriaceae bacterium]|nr:DNA polymerase III subunit gamma/tau [Ignavibacteriaceae bacterium]
MSDFIVTARKWRPQRFEDVVGQEHITSTLKNAIKENRIAHAYLFTGPRGVGKTTTARILAKTLNCTNRKNSEPCNECEMCLSIQNSQSIDIIEIDGASNRGIDEIRTLRESVKYAPTHGKYKVYIIDEVHMLTKESFNAFLKTLEEPPEHVIFIFATTDVHKVPLTIISRCRRYDFRRIQLDKIKETLKMIANEEKIKIDDKTLTIIAKKADGALRDAESYFDQVVAFSQGKIDAELVTQMLNLIDEEIYFNLSDAVLEKDYKVVFQSSEKIYENGWDFGDFLEGLIEHLRNILSAVITGSTNTIETADIYKNRYLEYKGEFSESDLLRLLNFLNKSQQELRYSQNQKLKIEIILSHLIALESTKTISELISETDSINVDDDKLSEPKTGFYKPTEPTKKKVDKIVKSQNTFETKQNKLTSKLVSPSENPIVESNFDFNEIVKKWESFVESISREKGLTLAPALMNFNLVSMSNNNLHFTTANEEDANTFRINDKYLSKKSEDFFGHRFNFILDNTQSISHPKKTSAKKIKVETKVSGDPYEEIILNELDGEKIA